jgi:NitT/TauT family transport system substrate-binding protein
VRSLIAVFAVFLLAAGQGSVRIGSDAAIIKLSPPEMITSLEGGTIDGAVMWEPWAALAVQRGMAECVTNSSEIWRGHPCCVIAAREDWSENNDDVLTGFVAAHIAATDWINRALNSNDSRLYDYAEQLTGLNRSVVEPALKNLKFDYEIDRQGIEEMGEELMKLELFEPQRWHDSGYGSVGNYISSVIRDDYVKSVTETKAKEVPFWQSLCSPALCPPQTAGKKTTVRIGYIRGILDHLPLFVAVGEGFLDRAGISPVLQAFDNGPRVMVEGFKMDIVDVAYLGIVPALLYGINANDGDLALDLISAVNSEGSSLLVRRGVREVKTLATPGPGTVQYFLALKVIDEPRQGNRYKVTGGLLV